MEDWQGFISERTDAEILHQVRSRPESVNAPDTAEQYLLQGAALYLRTELIEELLKLGADPNLLDSAGQLPLHSAIASYEDDPERSLAAVKLLLSYGADLEKRGYPDFTALHRACVVGAVEIVSLLLLNGADINARSEDRGDGGRRPLDVAEMHKHDAISQYLRERGGKHA